jgi:hypothetical protein
MCGNEKAKREATSYLTSLGNGTKEKSMLKATKRFLGKAAVKRLLVYAAVVFVLPNGAASTEVMAKGLPFIDPQYKGISQAELIEVHKQAYRRAGFILKEETSDVHPNGFLGKTMGIKDIKLTFEFSVKKEGVMGEVYVTISAPTQETKDCVPCEVSTGYKVNLLWPKIDCPICEIARRDTAKHMRELAECFKCEDAARRRTKDIGEDDYHAFSKQVEHSLGKALAETGRKLRKFDSNRKERVKREREIREMRDYPGIQR